MLDFYRALTLASEQQQEVRDKIAQYRQVNPKGCWLLPFSTSHGYTNLSIFGGAIRGHRAAYAAFIGEIPSGKLVMHRCDNRACVNPDHLRLGTQAENITDCRTKGRAFDQTSPELKSAMGREAAYRRVYTRKPKPPKRPRYHVLSDSDVALMRSRRLMHPKQSLASLASEFKTSISNVSMICAWKSRTKPLAPIGS